MSGDNQDPIPRPPDMPPIEVIQEFMAAFHKLWEIQSRIAAEHVKYVPSGAPCDPYEPVPCPGSGSPGGGVPAICEAINQWAQCWKDWGDEVHEKLFPSTEGVPPPPPPPFE